LMTVPVDVDERLARRKFARLGEEVPQVFGGHAGDGREGRPPRSRPAKLPEPLFRLVERLVVGRPPVTGRAGSPSPASPSRGQGGPRLVNTTAGRRCPPWAENAPGWGEWCNNSSAPVGRVPGSTGPVTVGQAQVTPRAGSGVAWRCRGRSLAKDELPVQTHRWGKDVVLSGFGWPPGWTTGRVPPGQACGPGWAGVISYNVPEELGWYRWGRWGRPPHAGTPPLSAAPVDAGGWRTATRVGRRLCPPRGWRNQFRHRQQVQPTCPVC